MTSCINEKCQNTFEPRKGKKFCGKICRDRVRALEYYRNNTNKVKTAQKKYRDKNKDKRKEYNSKYREANKEVLNEKNREYQRENHKDIIEKKRVYKKKRRETDPLYKMSCELRSRTRKAFKERNWKKNGATEKLLGTDWEKAFHHLESLFTKGMSWDNHGEWHIDHRSTLASALTDED